MIQNIKDLKDGVKYWYIGVSYQCHWKIYCKCEKYKDGHDWSNMIVFDNETDANKFMKKIQKKFDAYIIK